jgi:hypothetical protein
MLADLYNHDAMFIFQATGFDQLLGAAADIITLLALLVTVAVSIACLTQDRGIRM